MDGPAGPSAGQDCLFIPARHLCSKPVSDDKPMGNRSKVAGYSMTPPSIQFSDLSDLNWPFDTTNYAHQVLIIDC